MRISDWSSDVCSSDLILSSPIASSLPLRQCALMNAIPPRHDGPLAARDRVSRGHDVLSRLFAKAFHKVLDRIDTGLEHGALEAWLPDGTTRLLGGRQPGPVCEVHLHSWRALVRLGLSGSAGWYRAWAQEIGRASRRERVCQYV